MKTTTNAVLWMHVICLPINTAGVVDDAVTLASRHMTTSHIIAACVGMAVSALGAAASISFLISWLRRGRKA